MHRSYAEYHSNFINQLIHVTCVPLILATGVIFLLNTSLPPVAGVALSGAEVGVAAYILWYLYICPGPLGAAGAAFIYAIYRGALWSREAYGAGAWQPALAVHVVAWVLQFIGHGVFEGRAPALLDNLFQALFMAPIFVLIEVLMACGLLADFKCVR